MLLDNLCCEDDSTICDHLDCNTKTPEDCRNGGVVEHCPKLCGRCHPGNSNFLKMYVRDNVLRALKGLSGRDLVAWLSHKCLKALFHCILSLFLPLYRCMHLLYILLDRRTCCGPDSTMCDHRHCPEKTPDDCNDAIVAIRCPVRCKKCHKGNINVFY